MNLSRKAVQKHHLGSHLDCRCRAQPFGHRLPVLSHFGFPCPGCGMTRAALALLQLNLAAAWQFHPMVFALPYLLVLFLRDGRVFRNRALNIAVFCLVALGFAAQYFYKLFCLQ